MRGLLQICITMKLKKIYSSFIIFVLTITSVQAQYVYRDFPDTTLEINGDFFDLDLNNDTVLDFRFIQYRDTGTSGLIDHSIVLPFDSSSSAVCGSQRGFFFYADRLDIGESISYSSNPWQGMSSSENYGTIEYRFDSVSDPYSQWKDNGEGFIGLRLNKNDSLLYGWVRIEVTNGEKLIIKDCAYQSKLDSSIDAGHLWISLGEQFLNGHMGFVSGGMLMLSRPSNSSLAKTSIYNSKGQLLISGDWLGDNWSLPISFFKSDLFIVVAESKDGVWVERIVGVN